MLKFNFMIMEKQYRFSIDLMENKFQEILKEENLILNGYLKEETLEV